MLTAITALAILQSAAAQSPPAPASSPPPPCQSEQFAAFDFWVGEWNVFPNGSENQVAESRIEKLYNGCGVRENWMPRSGATGGSLSAYDPRSGQWHQTWVGSAPGPVNFVGGGVDGKMVLTGNWPSGTAQHTLIRMTYTANEDGSVRQHGEASTDHGLSWQTSFDFLYRPKEDSSE